MQGRVSIFVSHHRSPEENALTANLVSILRATGADVWVDLDQITFNDFVDQISKGMVGRQYIIVVQTPQALESKWVRAEGDTAVKMVIEGRMHAFIRFVVKPCDRDKIPALWSTFQAFDATRDSLGALASLLHTLGLAKDSVSPVPPLSLSPEDASSTTTTNQVTGKTIIFRDHKEALETAIEMLEQLPQLRTLQAGPSIRLTVQGFTLFKSVDDDLHDRWSAARMEALKKHWPIQAYWRLDDDLDRTSRWVKDMLVLLQIGAYEPRYFSDIDEPTLYERLLPFPYELLLIPRRGGEAAKAMLFLATHNKAFVDTAIYTEDEAFCSLLNAHFDALAKSTDSLFHTKRRQGFLADMQERENEGAGRLLVKPDLAVLTTPRSFYQGNTPWTRRARQEGWGEGELLALHDKRLDAFWDSSQDADYRDIYSKSALRKWVHSCTYSAYQSFKSGLQANPKQVKDHLANAIEMLEANEHYKIALIDDEQGGSHSAPLDADDAALTNLLWVIAGGKDKKAVFMEILKKGTGRAVAQLTNEINLRVDQSEVVGAFQDNFEKLWNKYSSPETEVGSWLKELWSTIVI